MISPYSLLLVLIVVGVGCLLGSAGCSRLCAKPEVPLTDNLKDLSDFTSFLPKNSEEIKLRTEQYIEQGKCAVQRIIDTPAEERTFDTVMGAIDCLGSTSDVVIWYHAVILLKETHPDAIIRDAAHKAIIKLQDFFLESMSDNKPLYDVINAYASNQANTEELRDDQRYFIQETLNDFKRSGLHLADYKRANLLVLKKRLGELCLEFSANIAQENRTITVTREGLAGVSEQFIAGLSKSEDGLYVVGADYPTYFTIIENCSVEDTRYRLYRLFNDRAYPANESVLKEVIAKRDEKAQLLGFASYAHLDLGNQMVETPERADAFLDVLLERALKKEQQEIAECMADLPLFVTLSEEGLLKPWDLAYIKSERKKKYYDIDESKVREYFPIQNTLEQLLSIYESFFSIRFEQVPVTDVWHPDVTALKVTDKDATTTYGYLFLDLYPRPNKYSHAAHFSIVLGRQAFGEQVAIPAVSAVVANFPKPTADCPSLLNRNEVSTFFHEFGHALHALLGAQKLSSFSGTQVKRDFVEMPSQMLEEWLYDAAILKQVSKHYQTGEPLPDDMIERIQKLKNFSSGFFLRRQAVLSKFALELHAAGADKDPQAIGHALAKRYYKNMVALDPDNHHFASFGHLTGYSAKYYGYMWAKVFAIDLFEEIKKHGLLNPVIGKKYADAVLVPGGSKRPMELLVDFLGREPNDEAFFRDMGLDIEEEQAGEEQLELEATPVSLAQPAEQQSGIAE